MAVALTAAIFACLMGKLSPQAARPPAVARAAENGLTLAGRLEITWADGRPGLVQSETHYRLLRPGPADQK